MTYHKAPALVVLTAEVNARWPGRDRASDGWIGDAAHRARKSDHNPDGDDGSVNAMDLDVDGIDVELLKRLVERDGRATYWIHARQIATAANGWRRAVYSGANAHYSHVHVSVTHGAGEDDTRPWGLATPAVATAKPKPTPPPPPPPPEEEDDMPHMIRKKSGATILVTGDRATPVLAGDDAAHTKAGIKTSHLSDAGFDKIEAALVSEKDR